MNFLKIAADKRLIFGHFCSIFFGQNVRRLSKKDKFATQVNNTCSLLGFTSVYVRERVCVCVCVCSGFLLSACAHKGVCVCTLVST